jgi:EAL domain-containing protein (putative c-di-GMP-specific phosphodiesterase class I)
MLPLLRHTIAAAREIGVTTVAEGIELEPDRRLLRELGCDLAQGYLIARPMHARALPLWRKNHVKASGTVIQLRP